MSRRRGSKGKGKGTKARGKGKTQQSSTSPSKVDGSTGSTGSTETAAATTTSATTTSATVTVQDWQPPRRGRVRLWPLLIVIVPQALLIALFYWFSSAYAPPPRLSAADVKTAPGADVTLTAELTWRLPRFLPSRLAGHAVEFRRADGVASTPLSATTDAEGKATVSARAPSDSGSYDWDVVATVKSVAPGTEIKSRFRLHVTP